MVVMFTKEKQPKMNENTKKNKKNKTPFADDLKGCRLLPQKSGQIPNEYQHNFKDISSLQS